MSHLGTGIMNGFFVVLLFLLSNQAIAEPFEAESGNSKIKIFPGNPTRYDILNKSGWGSDIRIVGHTHNDKECNLTGIPAIDLIKPSAHGTVCVRIEDGHVRFNDTGKVPPCLGAAGKFAVVYFQPNAGFIGNDKFEYSVDDTKGKIVKRVEVTVDVTTSVAGSAAGRAPSNDTHQPSGHFPLCQAALM